MKRQNISKLPLGGVKLEAIGFDPIQALADKFHDLQCEIEYQEKLKKNLIVPLTNTGKVVNYYADHHLSLLNSQINVADKLLRYKYARVPETINVNEDNNKSLVINLSPTRKITLGKLDDPDDWLMDENFTEVKT